MKSRSGSIQIGSLAPGGAGVACGLSCVFVSGFSSEVFSAVSTVVFPPAKAFSCPKEQSANR
jgi:hypothetical protein